jgi:hypothetical protein
LNTSALSRISFFAAAAASTAEIVGRIGVSTIVPPSWTVTLT